MGKGLLWAVLLLAGCASPPSTEPDPYVRQPFEPGAPGVIDPVEPPPNWAAVAHRFAPVWYHDVANGGPDGLGPKADFPTRWDYDGDLVHNNNWEHLAEDHPLTATIYYAIVATQTHYYITYTQYHARDWEAACTGVFTECHEGDLEDVRVIVERDPDHVITVMTDAHGENRIWDVTEVDFEAAAGDYSATHDAEHPHVRIYTQDKGHGPIPCRAHETEPFGGYLGFFGGIHCKGAPDETDFAGGDGLVLRAGAVPTLFETGLETATYELISYLDSFWLHRTDIGEGSVFRPDDAIVHNGETIGVQRDADQFLVDPSGNIAWKSGDLFFDPAGGTEYVYNPYIESN